MDTILFEKMIKIIIGLVFITTGVLGIYNVFKKQRGGAFIGGAIILVVAGFFLILNQFIKIGP